LNLLENVGFLDLSFDTVRAANTPVQDGKLREQDKRYGLRSTHLCRTTGAGNQQVIDIFIIPIFGQIVY